MKAAKLSFVFAVSAAIAIPVFADGEHYDVSPKIENGVIRTNAFFDADEIEVENVRVFFYTFGEDILLPPNELADPGFHPLPRSGFVAGSQIGLSAQGALQYWSGAGAIAFAPAAAGTQMSYAFGAGSATVSGSSVPANEVLLGPVDANGEFDDHLDTDITLAADPGIYYFTGRLSATQGGVTPSDTIHFLFGYDADEEALLSAAFFVRDNFAPGSAVPIPEPAMGVGAALALAGLLRRRR